MKADRDSLTVTFTITAGEVWRDPQGVDWYVSHTGVERGESQVHFKRQAVTNEEATTVARAWRKMGDK